MDAGAHGKPRGWADLPFTQAPRGELPGAVTSRNDDGRVAHAPLLHQCEQRCGIRRMEPDTAMRGRTTEAVDLVAAVDRIAAVEKDRVWHGRVVVLLREPRPFHSLRPIGATRRAIAGAAGRNYPSVTRHAVHRHRHLLHRLVDRDEDTCTGGDRGQA